MLLFGCYASQFILMGNVDKYPQKSRSTFVFLRAQTTLYNVKNNFARYNRTWSRTATQFSYEPAAWSAQPSFILVEERKEICSILSNNGLLPTTSNQISHSYQGGVAQYKQTNSSTYSFKRVPHAWIRKWTCTFFHVILLKRRAAYIKGCNFQNISLFGKNIILYSWNLLNVSGLIPIPEVGFNVGGHLPRFCPYFGI